MKKVCDACACGGKIKECKNDVYETITDGCSLPLTYCSKYNRGGKNENRN